MIRAFEHKDTAAVLSLFESNVPEYFDHSEQKDFEHYMKYELEDYLVIEHQGKIIGCGGINYKLGEKKAFISWDIIHPNFQGKGYGRKLTDYRLDLIKQNPQISLIIVRTSQFTFQFYEKMGFTLMKTHKDFWAQGIDMYNMQLSIDSGNKT